MQNIVDSFCQCFGTAPQHVGDLQAYSSSEAGGQQGTKASSAGSVPNTPDVKKRTRSLKLQDKQWDALFVPEPDKHAKRSAALQPRRSAERHGVSMEQAQAVAKAKLAASAGSGRKKSPSSSKEQKPRTPPGPDRTHKRKRSNSSSKDDIFRSKRQEPTGATQPNPFSRFLSNHPVFTSSLCFATPIRGSDEPDEISLLDDKSVVSDSNTLNTAEDTITSTVYYETTKLAGLQQKNPPMPLFNTFAVEEQDDIRQIVSTRSHSSVRLLDMYRTENTEEDIVFDEEQTPPASPARRGGGRTLTTKDSPCPAPITVSSSESSKGSKGSR
jgi:hypothetical protein